MKYTKITLTPNVYCEIVLTLSQRKRQLEKQPASNIIARDELKVIAQTMEELKHTKWLEE